MDFFFGSSGATATIFLGAGASALCLPASSPQSDLVLGSSSTAAGLAACSGAGGLPYARARRTDQAAQFVEGALGGWHAQSA